MDDESLSYLSKDALIKTQAQCIKILIAELAKVNGEVCGFDETIVRLQTNIRVFRARKKINQKELSLKTNIDYTYISKLEQGRNQNPSLKILLRFCRAFNCSLSELTGE